MSQGTINIKFRGNGVIAKIYIYIFPKLVKSFFQIVNSSRNVLQNTKFDCLSIFRCWVYFIHIKDSFFEFRDKSWIFVENSVLKILQDRNFNQILVWYMHIYDLPPNYKNYYNFFLILNFKKAFKVRFYLVDPTLL